MKIKSGMEQKYKDWYEKNKDPYGRRCFTYAECWAELLEDRIGDNPEDALQTIIKFAEEDSHTADTDGITGFMYGMAVSILSQSWVFGEELRIWHNKEYEYDGEGVVNPAVLTIKKQ